MLLEYSILAKFVPQKLTQNIYSEVSKFKTKNNTDDTLLILFQK